MSFAFLRLGRVETRRWDLDRVVSQYIVFRVLRRTTFNNPYHVTIRVFNAIVVLTKLFDGIVKMVAVYQITELVSTTIAITAPGGSNE